VDVVIRLAALMATIVLAVLPGPALAQEARGVTVLERFPASQNRFYTLAITACRRNGCGVEVRLTDGDRTIARHATGWQVAGRQATRADSEPAREIVVGSGPGASAWQFGAEASQSVLAARPVRLGADVEALLLMDMGGFEHVKREFMLVAAEGDALRRLWRGGDGTAGPWVSWIELAPNDADDRLIFFRAFIHPEPEQLDMMSVRLLAWDQAGRRVRERPARGLWAVVGGGYPDAALARAARDRAQQTSPHFWVLAPNLLLRRPDGAVALMSLTSFEGRARQLLSEARRSGFPQAFLTRANPGGR
jgi:hypothetical protein